MVREQHGLRMLHVRIARQNDPVILLGGIHQHMTQLQVGLHELLGQCLDAQARIGRHLVVARTAGVQALARLADAARQFALNGHVDVLVVDIKGKVASIDILLNLGQTLGNRLLVLGADDALCGQHLGMCLGTGDILLIEMLVDRQRCTELLRDLGHARLKTTTPKSHGTVPFRHISMRRCPRSAFSAVKTIYQLLVLHIPRHTRG